MSHVKVTKYISKEGVVISIKVAKSRIIWEDSPRDGYYHVVWERKPKRLPKEVTGLFRTKKQAVRVASLLNSMTRREAICLVKELYQKGGNDRSEVISKERSRYTGRSFAWPN